MGFTFSIQQSVLPSRYHYQTTLFEKGESLSLGSTQLCIKKITGVPIVCHRDGPATPTRRFPRPTPMKTIVLRFAFIIGAILLAMPVHTGAARRPGPPAAIGGVLDLTRWQLDRHGPLRLAGQWEFYWGALLSPDDFRWAINAGKNRLVRHARGVERCSVNGLELGGKGFATFRLRLCVDPRQGGRPCSSHTPLPPTGCGSTTGRR
jgi:hypothetical protein